MSINTKIYIELIDKLDLNQKEDRRAAVVILEDFYGTSMAIVGTDFLQLDETIHNDSLVNQWNRITTVLETRERFRVPDKFRSLMYKLKQLRDNVEHKYFYNPPENVVRELYSNAQDWKSWVLSESKAYHSTWISLEPREVMIQLVETNLEYLIRQTCGRVGEHSEEFRGVCNQAKSLKDRLENQRQKDAITRDLVLMLQYTYMLTQKHRDLTMSR